MANNEQIKVDLGVEVSGTADVNKLSDSVRNLNSALTSSGKGMDVTANSAKQMRNAMRLLPAQFTDVVTQLAGGQSPFLILLQQGGQVRDMFGGFGPMFQGLKAFLSPARLAIGGVAAAVVGLGMAYNRATEDYRGFSRALITTGGVVNATAGQLGNLSDKIGATTGSYGNARDAVTALAATGKFSFDQISKGALGLSLQAKVTGKDIKELAGDIVKMASDPAKAIAELNTQYGFLTLKQQAAIAQTQAEKGTRAALTMALEAYTSAMKDMEVQTERSLTNLEWLFNKTKSTLSSFGNFVVGLFRPDDDMAELDKKITMYKGIVAGYDNYSKAVSPGAFERDKAILADLERQKATAIVLNAQAAEYKGHMKDLVTFKASLSSGGSIEENQLASIERKKKMLKELLDLGVANGGLSQSDYNKQINLLNKEIEELGKTRNEGIAAANEVLLQKYQNNSNAIIDLAQKEQAELDLLRAKNQISEEDFINKSADLKKRQILANITLARQELAIESQAKTYSDADISRKQARIEQINGRIAGLSAQMQRLGIETKTAVVNAGMKPDSPYDTALQGLALDNTKLQWQIDKMGEYGDKITSSRMAQEAFNIASGKYGNITEDQKQAIMSLAEGFDNLTKSQQAMTAGVDYERQTKLIEAETQALNESALQKRITIAAQELENKGVKEGTEAYERLLSARIRALELQESASKSAFTGLNQGVTEYLENMNNMAQRTKEVFTKVTSALEDTLVNFFTTGKLGVKEFAFSIVTELTRAAVQMLIMKPIIESFKEAMGGMSSGGGFGGFIGSLFGFADGGIMTSSGSMPLKKYANGGIANSPQLAMFGEGRMPEAYVPLPDGRSIPVTMKGGASAGGETSVVVNVSVEKGSVDVAANNGQKAGELGRMIAGVVKQELLMQKRPGGLLAA